MLGTVRARIFCFAFLSVFALAGLASLAFSHDGCFGLEFPKMNRGTSSLFEHHSIAG